jgi:hypothetical protein
VQLVNTCRMCLTPGLGWAAPQQSLAVVDSRDLWLPHTYKCAHCQSTNMLSKHSYVCWCVYSYFEMEQAEYAMRGVNLSVEGWLVKLMVRKRVRGGGRGGGGLCPRAWHG